MTFTPLHTSARSHSLVHAAAVPAPVQRLRAFMLAGVMMLSCLALSLSTSVQAQDSDSDSEGDKRTSLHEQLDTFARVLQIIRKEYVDDVDDEEVIEAAIQGMLKSLDPHSTYLNQDIYQQVRVQMEGEYGGLGLEVQMESGVVKVISPIDDTPAAKAGISGGDFITHIDGKSVLGKTLTEAVRSMRGPVGAPIVVTVVREGVEEPFEIEIIRDRIVVRSVRHRVEDETIGYIRVTTFNQQSGEGVEDAVKALKSELGSKLDGVILDLRNNPGGLLNEAIRISDAFLDHGEIVSTRGRRRTNNNRWYATSGDMLDGVPVVVLVNAYSASASEIVAGALKDHRRAIILGENTFGKGTVQTETRLGAGDHAIRLTTARYYTPSGQSIQGRGIEPDIDVLFPRDLRRPVRREADLDGYIENEQAEKKRSGEIEISSGAENTPALTPAIETSEEPEASEDAAVDAVADAPIEDVQLKYAIRLLKDMAQPLKRTVADAADTVVGR